MSLRKELAKAACIGAMFATSACSPQFKAGDKECITMARGSVTDCEVSKKPAKAPKAPTP